LVEKTGAGHKDFRKLRAIWAGCINSGKVSEKTLDKPFFGTEKLQNKDSLMLNLVWV